MRKVIQSVAAAALAVTVAASLAACSSKPEPVQPSTAQISDLTDLTASPYYTVTAPVAAVTDQFGTHVRLQFAISNANHTIFNPRVTLSFADGSSVTCQEDDLRRLPALNKTTTSWEFPCDGPFPADLTGARAAVVDTYK